MILTMLPVDSLHRTVEYVSILYHQGGSNGV